MPVLPELPAAQAEAMKWRAIAAAHTARINREKSEAKQRADAWPISKGLTKDQVVDEKSALIYSLSAAQAAKDGVCMSLTHAYQSLADKVKGGGFTGEDPTGRMVFELAEWRRELAEVDDECGRAVDHISKVVAGDQTAKQIVAKQGGLSRPVEELMAMMDPQTGAAKPPPVDMTLSPLKPYQLPTRPQTQQSPETQQSIRPHPVLQQQQQVQQQQVQQQQVQQQLPQTNGKTKTVLLVAAAAGLALFLLK
jgi:hypothetical protein